MNYPCKSFFLLAVIAAHLGRVNAVGHDTFTQLSDLSRNNEEISDEIGAYFNYLIGNLVEAHLPLDVRLASIGKYRNLLYASPSSIDSTNQAIKELRTIFKEELNQPSESDFNSLLQKCERLFIKFILYLMKSNFSQENLILEKQRFADALATEAKAIYIQLKKGADIIKAGTARLSKDVETTLEVSVIYKDQFSDFLKFKRKPVEVLLESCKNLIDAVNKNPSGVTPKLDSLNDRIFEYAKAMVIISKRRQQSWSKAILSIIEKLRSHASLYKQDDSDPLAYKWNVLLMRKLLQLLNANDHQEAAMVVIQSFLNEEHFSDLSDSKAHKVIRRYYITNVLKEGIPIEDFDHQSNVLKIIDYALYLWSSHQRVLSVKDADKIINNFEKLAHQSPRKLKSLNFQTIALNHLGLNIDSFEDLYLSFYEAIVDMRNKKAGILTDENSFEILEDFLDEKQAEEQNSPFSSYYLMLKIFLAQAFLKGKDYTLKFNQLPQAIIEKTKKLMKHPEFESVRNILISLLYKKVGNVRKEDVENEAYVSQIAGKQFSTKNIGELAHIAFDDIIKGKSFGSENQKAGFQNLHSEITDGSTTVGKNDGSNKGRTSLNDELRALDNQQINHVQVSTKNFEVQRKHPKKQPVTSAAPKEVLLTKQLDLGQPLSLGAPHTTQVFEEPSENEDIISKARKPVVNEPSMNEVRGKDEIANKLATISKGNLVHVLTGELTPQQFDLMRFGTDIIGVIRERKVELSKEGKGVEYIYVRYVRADSRCYEDSISQLFR